MVGRLHSLLAQGDLYNLFQSLLNRITNSGALVVATQTDKLKIAVAIDFSIEGQFYNKAITDNIVLTAGTNLTAGQESMLRIEISTAGTVTAKQGPIILTTAGVPIMPRRSASLATIGFIRLAVAAGFTFGTTALNAAGVTIFNGDPDLGNGSGSFNPDRGLASEVNTAP